MLQEHRRKVTATGTDDMREIFIVCQYSEHYGKSIIRISLCSTLALWMQGTKFSLSTTLPIIFTSAGRVGETRTVFRL